jgi:DNA-directed RNA polymerase subunit beta'
MDLDKEIASARAAIQSGKKTARDAAIRKLKYLKNAKRLGIHPKDWVLTKAPVLPPAFRPVSTMGPKKLPLVADPNYLYKELFEANQSLRDMSEQVGDDVADERLATYNALKGVVGLGDPIHPRNRERQVRGILKHVFGTSPKVGVVQRRLLGSSVDLVGRSVITPNPDLDMDHVGIPESKAWEIYKPFIVRRLVRTGSSRIEAARAADARSPIARQALVQEMESRPVVINRAPTLHRYGMMAAWPKLVKGDTLQISPLVVGGFGADFDGDAMNYHVPSTDEAAHEAAEKMLPSRNLLSAASFGVHYLPSQEYVGGLYEASARQDKKNKPLVFDRVADAIRAYREGRINVDREVHIMSR